MTAVPSHSDDVARGLRSVRPLRGALDPSASMLALNLSRRTQGTPLFSLEGTPGLWWLRLSASIEVSGVPASLRRGSAPSVARSSLIEGDGWLG